MSDEKVGTRETHEFIKRKVRVFSVHPAERAKVGKVQIVSVHACDGGPYLSFDITMPLDGRPMFTAGQEFFILATSQAFID